MPDAPDTLVANSACTPAGFTVLQGSEGVEYLACGEEHVESYAVRVVTDGRSAIAGRVRSEAAASIPGVSAGAVVWDLGVAPQRAGRTIVVHRPFGAIVEF